MISAPTSRRRFLRQLVRCFGALAVAGLGGCAASGPDREAIAARVRQLDPDLSCTDTTGLWPAEIRTRTDNGYLDRSDKPDRFCFNCTNFVPPPTGTGCGSCRTVKGPINPGGWCKAWTELA